MKRISYSESQIISILKEAESGIPVPELCRKHGMGNSTFYKWRAKYGGMDASPFLELSARQQDFCQLVSAVFSA